MFDDQTRSEIEAVAKEQNIEPAALLAVVETESEGRAFAVVNGRYEPLIRFEGHYFDRLVPPAKRARARAAGLANPKAGAVKNPSSQAARWNMFARAAAIDRAAAIQSMSFGVGQVMGANWQDLGYASPEAFLAEARSGVAGQVRLMAKYIRVNGLADELRRHDWSAFARAYNGPNYRAGRYDDKMAAAYARYAGKAAPAPSSAGMLRLGSRGERVRELQALLRRAGYPVTADGDFGPATKRAVEAFQRAAGVEVDGVVGPQTQRLLAAFKTAPAEEPGRVPVTADPDVGKGLGAGVGGAAVVETANQTIQNTLVTYGETLPHSVAVALSLLAAGLAIGGLAYAGWKIIAKRGTREGTA